MKYSLIKTLAALTVSCLVASAAHAITLTPGNVFVYRVGTGAAALGSTATAVFIDEYTTAGVLVQSIAMPTAASGANGSLSASGTATTDGFLTASTDGRYLIIPGYDTAVGTAGNVVSNANPRVIGRLALDGTIDTTTRLTDPGASNFRSVASTNGTDLWMSGALTGVRYTTLGSTTSTQLSTTSTNTRVLGIADGQLYVSSAAGSLRLGSVGSGLPTAAGQVINSLPGFPTSTLTSNGFFFADLSSIVPGVDTLYVADESSGLLKYGLDTAGGNWLLKGTVGTSADLYRGLTGNVSGGAVTLYATSPTKLVSVLDNSAVGGSFGSSVLTLATAGTNTAMRGVALLASPVPEPGTWALWLAGAAGLGAVVRRKRKA